MPARADPDLGLRLAAAVRDLYATASEGLLAAVARRLGEGIDRPGWADRKLSEVNAFAVEAQRIVDRLRRASPAAVEAALAEAYRLGGAQAVADLLDAGVLVAPAGAPGAVLPLVAELTSGLASTHGQILRQVLDVYRRVVAEASGPVLVGAQTRRGAAQAALDRFAARGVTGFVDSAGRRWELESYAEMATRSAVGRAQVNGTLDRLAGSGMDLVIVSDHGGECRLCRPWEARVLSISGTDPAVPSVAAARSAGLLHPGCRHRLSAFIPGLTEVPKAQPDPEGDRARREQRRLERGVRQWKRRAAAAVDDDARRAARRHARQWQGRLREHVAAEGLKRRPERERLGAR